MSVDDRRGEPVHASADVSGVTSDATSDAPVDLPIGTAGEGERRRGGSAERVSWASRRPYLASLADGATDPREAAERRRRDRQRPVVVSALALDATSAAVVATLTCLLTDVSLAWSVVVVPACVLVWCLALALSRGYDGRRLGSGPDEFSSVARAAASLAAGSALAVVAADIDLHRAWILASVPAVAAATVLGRRVVRHRLYTLRRNGSAVQQTLLVGDAASCADVARDLGSDSRLGYQVAGSCGPAASGVLPGVPLLGGLADVAQVVVDHRIDVVVVAGTQLRGPALRRLSWALEQVGADLVVSPGVVEVAGPHVSVRPTAGMTLLHLERPSRHLGRALGKAVLDRTLGTVALLVAAVPLIVLGAMVGLTSRGPVLYRQVRAGRDGQPFDMLKLRTMVVDADARLAAIAQDSDRDGPMFKMKRDPRVTAVGRMLRRFSLDELPQLWNVVRGDMSLVGPRPPLMSEFAQYHDAVNRRLLVRPGLTGLWQVSGRADLPWEESVTLDLRYVDNWSLALDLQIMWRTLRAVITGSGAY